MLKKRLKKIVNKKKKNLKEKNLDKTKTKKFR